MTLEEFLQQYDKPGSIVLLEGKRKVREEDQEKLVILGNLLAFKSRHMLFRSGNADGSDQFFSKGVAGIDYRRLQVITPYSGHRRRTNLAYETVALDEIDLAAETEVVYQSKGNKKTEWLIEQYVGGNRNAYSIKAAYIIRDTVKVIGTLDVKPATFGIFYDDLHSPENGGTGHTMRVCRQNNIPLIDQSTWFQWLMK
ncbi:MAG: hypothetical protein ACOCYD_00475 [bacterium]